MGDIAMILVIGGVGLYALYAYNQGALGTTTGTTEFIPGESYVDPTTGTGIPATNATCQQEGGIWQGYCCSCPNNNCHTKCGVTDVTQRDVCVHEGGLWEPNGIGEDNDKGCCRCPNLDCSDKCGANQNDSGCGGDDPGCSITTAQRLEGICKSEGVGNAWNFQRNCCSCPNKTCQHKCPGPPAPKDPGGSAEERKRMTEGQKKLVREGSTGDRKPDGTPKPITPAKPKPAAACPANSKCANGKCFQKCPSCKSQCNSPGTFDACCKAQSNYARSYLAGSSNRLGPSYTHRDDFRHLTHVEFPAPIDFLEEATFRPYYLGNDPHPLRKALIDRFDLNANANSNFSMRFSGQ